MIDLHSHILPGLDDGAKDVETALAMLDMLHGQGVTHVVATPHFYAHREKSVAHFLEKRQRAYEKLTAFPLPVEIALGAEISIELGVGALPEIQQLAIGGTDLVLLEPSYHGYNRRMLEEIDQFSVMHHLTPVIAHIHRYCGIYSKDAMAQLLQADAIFQINNEAFGSFRACRFVKRLLRNGYPVLFGSDTHNLDSRKPNFDLLLKKTKPEWRENAERIFYEHTKRT